MASCTAALTVEVAALILYQGQALDYFKTSSAKHKKYHVGTPEAMSYSVDEQMSWKSFQEMLQIYNIFKIRLI